MIPVAEARARILAAAKPLAPEWVYLSAAWGRTLAAPLMAQLTHPPVAVSAMDGYAVRGEDIKGTPARLTVIGSAAAGQGYRGPALGKGEAVRIFTGAPMPQGADTVIIQENVENLGAPTVILREAGKPGQNVRAQGSDFASGSALLPAGRPLDAPALALAAGSGHATLPVVRRPRVAIIATGDELVQPGMLPGSDQIVSCNGIGISALVAAAGGIPHDLGIARDTPESIAQAARAAKGADVLVTIGGASVGDHDLVRPTLEAGGITLAFWKIAMRPGKPLMFGTASDGLLFMGLPGNPVSALICGLLFLRPLILALQGLPPDLQEIQLKLATPLPTNDKREDYLRAVFELNPEEGRLVRAFTQQNSGQLAIMAQAEALIRRPPLAPAAPAGTLVPVLPLADLW